MGGNDSAAYRTVSGHETAGRLALAVLSLLAAFVFTILVLCLNCFIALNLMLSLMMLALGGFFTMVWAIPGAPRQWGNNWLRLLFGFTIVSFLGQLVLSVTLTVAVAAISLTASMGWASSVVLTLTCMVAALVLMWSSSAPWACAPGANTRRPLNPPVREHQCAVPARHAEQPVILPFIYNL